MSAFKWDGDKFLAKVEREMERRMSAAVGLVEVDVKQSINRQGPTKTGRKRFRSLVKRASKGNTYYFKGKGEKRQRFATADALREADEFTRASRPGEPPKSRTGNLKRNVFSDRTKEGTIIRGQVAVGDGAKYGKYLERGTSRMKARPFLEVGFRRNLDRVASIFRKPL